MKFHYDSHFHTESHINSIKFNTEQYLFYTQKNTIQLTSPSINTQLVYSGHNNSINSIDILDDQLLSCSSNIQIHNLLQNEAPIRKFYKDDPFKINQVIFLNNSLISSVDDNKSLKIFDLKQSTTFKPIQTYSNPKDSINCVCYDDGGFSLICGSNDGNLYTYDLRMGLLYIDQFQTPITSIKARNGGVLINCLNQGLIKFDIKSKQKVEFGGIDRSNDEDYKYDNAILEIDDGYCYVTGSRHKLYGFGGLNDVVEMKGSVLSSIDHCDGCLVIGSDYGVEKVRVND